jgi:hypothetical protein
VSIYLHTCALSEVQHVAIRYPEASLGSCRLAGGCKANGRTAKTCQIQRRFFSSLEASDCCYWCNCKGCELLLLVHLLPKHFSETWVLVWHPLGSIFSSQHRMCTSVHECSHVLQAQATPHIHAWGVFVAEGSDVYVETAGYDPCVRSPPQSSIEKMIG